MKRWMVPVVDDEDSDYPPITTAEARRFWRGVLAQAVQDALAEIAGNTVDRGYDLMGSIGYVSLDNPDFVEVCDNAGIEADYFIRKLLALKPLDFQRAIMLPTPG